ncbi:NADH:flavin oxidoreductase/NADH oxidase [Pusillimonas sp. SM2304]|uniref:NADH:flavin oxidoreductase/NADH oxidase n=1 Tax=Pusillimonas sp. SM2304 TaxID=3073241 RepID=UPI0028765D22|nr:NADH:flavin oxidoreductase/NADH oxidase [Pusillimonas sp. SM2304]MDS1138813.1 NADH:flavin oxidoreductase/NADH oxidase [Pusillimonas sp. SM2304]
MEILFFSRRFSSPAAPVYTQSVNFRPIPMNSLLFSPFRIRDITLKNRVGVAPMCQYSATDGIAGPWHVVHLGSRAVGGAGLVFVEAAAVSAGARISDGDIGIWNDAHVAAFRPITAFAKSLGATPGIQLAHAGRKGSTQKPWQGRKMVDVHEGGWTTVAPSALPFNDEYPMPAAMTEDDMARVIDDFVQAAQRSLDAGFDVLELHMGHGYLLHEFLSPLSNLRTDAWGGSFEGRTAFPLSLAKAVRAQWPSRLPLFVRISATDWVDGGWDLDQSIQFARLLREAGVDLVDCSSGSIVPGSRGEPAPGFQVPLAAAIRKEAQVATAAVGLITEARQAEEILVQEQADLVLIGRALLADPYWPLRAQGQLDGTSAWPIQYDRAVNPNALT